MNQVIADILSRKREVLDLKRDAVAHLAGISTTTLFVAETRGEASFATVRKLLRFYGRRPPTAFTENEVSQVCKALGLGDAAHERLLEDLRRAPDPTPPDTDPTAQAHDVVWHDLAEAALHELEQLIGSRAAQQILTAAVESIYSAGRMGKVHELLASQPSPSPDSKARWAQMVRAAHEVVLHREQRQHVWTDPATGRRFAVVEEVREHVPSTAGEPTAKRRKKA